MRIDGDEVAHISRSPKVVFRDFRGRRSGMIKAFTTEVEKFYGLCDPDRTQFNASQYAFFGNSSMEEVELGGFEDDDVGSDPGYAGIDEEGYQFSHLEDKVDGEVVGSVTDIDDLAIAFPKADYDANVISKFGSNVSSQPTFDTEAWIEVSGGCNKG